MRTETRKSTRFGIQWPVKIQTTEGPVEAKLKNLGSDGAYIYCGQTVKPHDFVAMRIFPPNRSPLGITAEVMWVDKLSSPGMGVRFRLMSEKDRQFLHTGIAKQYQRKSGKESSQR